MAANVKAHYKPPDDDDDDDDIAVPSTIGPVSV